MPTAKPKAGHKALRLKSPSTAPTSGLRPPLKRASILPQKNVDLWIDPGDTYVEPAKYDLFHNPANKLSLTPLAQLPEHLQQEPVGIESTTSATASKVSKGRALPSGPTRHIQKGHGALVARKRVRWDPAIVATGPIITEKPTKFDKSIKAAEVKLKVLNVKETVRQGGANRLEITEAVKAIKKWTKDDTAKLKRVLQALKDLGFDDEEANAQQLLSKSGKEVDVVLTKVKSLNPRVPEFESSACSKKLASPGNQSQEHSVSKGYHLIDPLKENVPMQQSLGISSSGPATARKRTICDDYREHGRTVAAFDHWYAEKQLLEFMKKYPMTGKKAPVIQKQASVRQNQHEMVKTGPTSGRHAAMIQQRLEFLLWKAKEKEAMRKGLAAQAGLQHNY